MTKAKDTGLRIRPGRPLRGETGVPGDKSISHRVAMLGALARGTTRIRRFLPGADCLATVACLQKLGVETAWAAPTELLVYGRGLGGLQEPAEVLDVGNSGTTLRLLCGILAGQRFFSALTGDASIRRRPMARVTKPLREMGAVIFGRENACLAPLAICGQTGPLRPLHLVSEVASAQVKSAVLLAGLFAEGWTRVAEPCISRDHTERLLAAFGAQVVREADGLTTAVAGFPELDGVDLEVPGDISAAAFLLVAASLVSGSAVTIRGVGVNPTRDGVLAVLREMGGDIRVENRREVAGEPVADITVKSAALHGVTIQGDIIPRLIDEIPVLAVAALFARGTTEIRDAGELRVKESDRIAVLAGELKKMGALVEELPDGLVVHGGETLRGAMVESHGDHRIAMALAVAGLLARGETTVRDTSCLDVSFPGFAFTLEKLRR